MATILPPSFFLIGGTGVVAETLSEVALKFIVVVSILELNVDLLGMVRAKCCY